MNPTPDPLAPADLAQLLERAATGDRDAFDRVFRLLYDELYRLARAQRSRWQGNTTLNTTVILHEAYLKLAGFAAEDREGARRWEGRRHFFALIAQVMRQVLVNYAEAERTAKRGGGARHLSLEALETEPDAAGSGAQELEDFLAIDAALTRLAAIDPRQARIVECRCFAGMSIPETAEALDLSPATVKRDWAAASAWLSRALRP